MHPKVIIGSPKTMTQFNYKKAWAELAAPACLALPPNVLQLVGEVLVHSNNISQAPDLSVPWINDSLKEKFQEIPDEDLAKAARIVWATGHWHPGADNWLRPLMRTGAYWKFSAYADTILRERINLDNQNNTLFFEIHEGFIRACIDFDRSWMWTEVGLATQTVFKELKRIITCADTADKNCLNTLDKLNLIVEHMKICRESTGPISKLFGLEDYYG